MTTVIDERVVEMKFNNADFEKNVAQSMATLDNLKKSLNFDSAKSLEELGKASKNFTLTGVTETISEATTKFSALEIAGVTAIAKITSAAMDFGAKFVKSLSIDQVSAGFNKYAEKTTAVQTIIAATSKSIEEVEAQMEKLNWFTDETSYNFVDMSNNIGKFTSNGVELKEAASAMQGIAAWTARSGQNATTAGRAMYNFSQALGSGAMMVKDWMSIEQANMATTEFKQTAIDTAVELGKLTKVSEGLYTTLDGKTTVSVNEFRDSLKKKWFDSEVIIATLNKYNQYAEELYALSEKTGRTATQLMMDADKFAQGNLDLGEIAASSKMSVEELTEAYTSLNSETNKLSREAFKNAQEAKTFQEVLDATADAVSTSWMNTFQLIFGNYEEAKALWSGMANLLVDAFTQGGTVRNEILSIWRDGEIDGRVKLIEGLVNVLNALVAPLKAIKAAFTSFLPSVEEAGGILNAATIKFADFTAKLIPSERALGGLYNTFRGIFAIGKAVVSVFTSLVKAIIPAAKPFGSLLEMLLVFTGYVGAVVTAVVEYAEEVGIFKAITEGFAEVLKKIVDVLKTIGIIFAGGVVVGIQKVISFITSLIDKLTKFITTSEKIQNVIKKISDKVNKLKKLITGAEKPVEKINTVIKKTEEYFGAASDSGAEFGTVMKDVDTKSQKALTPLQKVQNVLKNVAIVFTAVGLTIGKAIVTLATKVKNFFVDVKNRFVEANQDSKTFLDYIMSIFEVLGSYLGDVSEKLKEFFDSLGIDTDGIKAAFDTIGGAISTLIGNITPGKIAAISLSVALLALVGAAVETASKFGMLVDAAKGLFANINTLLKKQFAKTSLVTDIAKSFALIAGSIALLTLVDQDKLVRVSGIMAGFIGVFTLLTVIVGALANKFSKVDFNKNFASMSKSILTLAASMTVLALALAIISKIEVGDPNEMWMKVEASIVMLGSLAAIATAMSHWAKDLPKGAILLLALAVSMRQLVKALLEFSELPYDDINKNWAGFIAMFGGLAAVIAASGQIKIGSALGLLILGKALQTALPAITDIIEEVEKLPLTDMLDATLKKLDENKMIIVAAVGFLGFCAVCAAKLKSTVKPSIGNTFQGIGGTIAALGLSFGLITLSIKSLKETMSTMTPEKVSGTFMAAIGIIGTIAAFFGAMVVLNAFDLKGTLDKNFNAMALSIVALGASINLITKAVNVIANTNMEGLAAANATIIGIGTLLGVVLYAASNVTKALPAIGAMIGVCTAIGVLMGELAIMSLLVTAPHIDDAMVYMGIIVLELAGLMKMMSGLRDVKTGPMIALAASLAIIATSLAVLSFMNIEQIGAAALSMSLVIGVLAIIMDKMNNTTTIGAGKAKTLLSAVAVLGAVALSLWAIAQQDWKNIRAAGGMMALALGAIAGVLAVLDLIGSKGGTLEAAASIGALAVSMLAIAASIKLLDGVDWGAFGMFAAAIGTLAGVLIVLGAITAIFPPFGVALGVVSISLLAAAASFGIVAISFVAFAAALPLLADGINALVPALTNLASVPFFELVSGIGAFALAGAGIGILSPLLLAASVALLAFGAAIWAVDNILKGAGEGLQIFADGFKAVGNAIGEAANWIKEKIKGLVDSVKSLLPDLAGALTSPEGTQNVAKAALSLAKVICGAKGTGSGLLGGISLMLGWNSPPKFIEELMGDTATAFGMNETAVSAATASGKQIGDGFGKSMLSSISEWVSGLGPKLSAMFSGFSFNFSGFSDAVSNDVDPAIQKAKSGLYGYNQMQNKLNNTIGEFSGVADKFASKTDNSSNKLDLLGRVTEKVNDGWQKGKEIIDGFIPSTDFINDAIKDATEGMLEGTDATEGFAEGLDGVGESAGKAGSSLKDFASTVKDTIANQLDMFTKFDLKTGITADQMLENMRSNIDGFASWSHRMTVLAERFADHGIDGLYEKLAEMGPKGYETMNAFYTMSEEQLDQVRDLWATGLTLPDTQASIIGDGYKYIGEMMVKGVSSALDDHKALHASIHGLSESGKKDFQTEWEIHSPSGVTKKYGEYMLMGIAEGLNDTATRTWLTTNIHSLCTMIKEEFTNPETGISAESFKEVGEAIMTDFVEGVFVQAGLMSVEGFAKAFLALETVTENIQAFCDYVKKLFTASFLIPMGDSGEASYSIVFYNYGLMMLEGLSAAFAPENEKVLALMELIKTFCDDIKNKFIEGWEMGGEDGGLTRSEVFYEIGCYAMQGLEEGIREKGADAIAAAEEIMEQIIAIMEKIPKISSPSKVTHRIGAYISEGLEIGIREGAENVYNAAKMVAESSMNGITDNVGRIQDVINTDLDLNPIITPMLDLSYLRQQLNEVDNMFASKKIAAEAQNGGAGSGNATPSTINYTQNNYSPKSLSRYEIYRQTRNQLSQLKGALG